MYFINGAAYLRLSAKSFVHRFVHLATPSIFFISSMWIGIADTSVYREIWARDSSETFGRTRIKLERSFVLNCSASNTVPLFKVPLVTVQPNN